MFKNLILVIVLTFGSFLSADAQKSKSNIGKPQGKYPSVFWEITGNGLKKPSYLFGTMHVSMKLAFNLSDSFYNAMQAVDMVALELNPQQWQSDMMEMDAAQKSYGSYYLQQFEGDFLNEHSFQLTDYYENLEEALTSKPQQINGLLYRSFAANQDYEEDTYLDLYLYQTGRKYGKLAGGVEDYKQMQIILTDAFTASVKEKNNKTKDTDGESIYEIQKKIKEAYRKGDLDALDSLNQFENSSAAYTELFLYKRNETQAQAIDSLLKKYSLFTGVGAAHLPGSRGVIELLRKKGYKLRPIFMQDRDAAMKENIDKLKVPVVFSAASTEDGFISVQIPGKLYKLNNSFESRNPLWQYADMENGSYYMITRVKTHGTLLGQKPLDVMDKVDSLLYENIPGKILTKKEIVINGYPGFDITNRTRRGDLQRYHIVITPFEIIVFKMSGTGDYVQGEEASTFFGSIKISKAPTQEWSSYSSQFSGFKIDFPHHPFVQFNTEQKDGNKRWEFEAFDETTGNSYFVWKKSLYNYNFLEEDSFDVSLIEESFKASELIDKEISRQQGNLGVYPTLRMSFSLKGGGFINALAVLKGNHYFLIGERTARKTQSSTRFFSAFALQEVQHEKADLFTDTLLGFSVQTTSTPIIDSFVSSLVNRVLNDKDYLNKIQGNAYWKETQYSRLSNDSTGDELLFAVYEFPMYFQSKDSSAFWKNELEESRFAEDWILKSKTWVQRSGSVGYKMVWTDTNTIRQYETLKLLRDNKLFSIIALRDSTDKNNAFINQVFNSFTPLAKKKVSNVFEPKLDSFFAHLYSPDSLTRKKARAAIRNVYYGGKDIDRITNFINGLKYGEEDYFGMKSDFVRELGYINDSCCTDKLVEKLLAIYQQTADTGYFQNEVFDALVHLKTTASYAALKKLLLQDPPVFNSEYNYTNFFERMEDSLALARTLFPELLQLTSIQDYKNGIYELLAVLVDSGFIKATDYKDHFTPIWIDARIEMKKQQNNEEKLMEKETQLENNPDADEEENSYVSSYDSYENYNDVDLYARLLMPFYKENNQLLKLYSKLLTGRDTARQLSTAVLMANNGISIPDSVWKGIAARDQYRYRLYSKLEDHKLEKYYPVSDKDQVLMARSALLASSNAEKYEAIELVGKQHIDFKGTKGWVYFFRYKMKDDEDWQMGISGIQPDNLKSIGSNDDFIANTDKKLSEDKPVLEQFEKELHKMIIMKHNSGTNFFDEAYGYDTEDYYED